MPGPTRTPRRPSKRVARPSLGARVVGGLAFAARATGRPIAAQPVLSTSLAGFAIFFGMVATNALYAQSGRHAHPLLTTRPDAAAQVPVAAEDDPGAGLPVPLVAEVQSALARAGYYAAPVDGRPGRNTAAAIKSFQSDNGLRVDGEATPKLLASLRKVEEERALADADTARVASLDPAETGTTNDGTREAPAMAAQPQAGDTAADRDLVRRIQMGLADAKVAELQADGIMGARTQAAIRSFQASQGLDVTGQPDRTVLDRLTAMGARTR